MPSGPSEQKPDTLHLTLMIQGNPKPPITPAPPSLLVHKFVGQTPDTTGIRQLRDHTDISEPIYPKFDRGAPRPDEKETLTQASSSSSSLTQPPNSQRSNNSQSQGTANALPNLLTIAPSTSITTTAPSQRSVLLRSALDRLPPDVGSSVIGDPVLVPFAAEL